MRRALPLSVQLLLTLVLLLVGVTAVLTRAAYTSLRTSLETEAARNVDELTRTHEQAFTQLFQLRQQRAEGFLASVESLCAEPTSSGRLAWVDDCTRTMVNDFRKSERALGAVLRYRNRTIRRSGRVISGVVTPAEAFATIVRGPDGSVTYAMIAAQRQTALMLLLDDDGVAHLFRERAGPGSGDEVILVDDRGEILAPQREDMTALPSDRAAEFLKHCRSGGTIVDVDYRGVKAFQSFRRARALGTACIAAARGSRHPRRLVRSRGHCPLARRGAMDCVAGQTSGGVGAQAADRPVRPPHPAGRPLRGAGPRARVQRNGK